LRSVTPPSNGRSPSFVLLNGWLVDCNDSHDCIAHQDHSLETAFRPTRVIFVGSSDQNSLKLAEPAGRIEYVALSHRWGEPSDGEKEKYCTTDRNFN